MICYLFPEPTYFFFTPDAPALLYYALISTTVIALLVGFYVFWSGKQFLLNRLLFAISLSFLLWTLSNLIEWTNIHSDFIMFVWNFQGVILGLVAIFCIYFIYVFLDKKDVLVRIKAIFLSLLAPIFILTPTVYLSGFNITDCDAFKFEWSPFKIYYTLLGVLVMIWILVLLIRRYRVATPDFKKQIVLMGTGIELFLFLFFIWTNLIYYLTDIGIFLDSRLEIYGLFGIVIFMIYISILIVQFKTFNIKLIATQALVWGLALLIGSQFLFIKVSVNFILNGIGFLGAIILGQYLIKSVKKEIEAKENERLQHIKFEELAGRFENINHILAHDVKNTLGKNKDIFIETLAGTFGEITDQGKSFFKRLATDTVDLIASVTNILKAGDKIKPDPKPFDLKQTVLEVVESVKDSANVKALKIETTIDESQNYTVNADRSLIVQHVLKNLIENAVNYNIQNGSIWINLSKKDPKTVLLVVKDNGHGMTEETKKKLFTAGGHGEDSIKFNVHTSGYGLLIARQTMDAHHGKVDGNSEGKEKGSTFFMELPVDFTPAVSEAPKV
jgi:signal transduction histidine kinase